MIDIKDIQGNVILSVPITQECKKVEELMMNDYIQLSWNSDSSDEIPLGAYIEHNGEKYSLLEPYTPMQKNEVEFVYTPQFKSRVMAWGKMPFFFYSGESKEPDWTLTSNPADFMKMVCDSILEETGESWTYSIDASLPASASLSFTSVDILSGLNQIASAFETEWFADKSTNTLYLGLLSHGEEVTLEVGVNINTPSVNSSKEGYYTRFYAFGSTRNITQDYEGSNTNNLVNKRLTLDPTKYPNGYKDIREGLSEGEIFSKVLIFDKVYPSAKLSISGVRNRLMYRLDSNGDKIQVGTDDSGSPIYDQYAIWHFRIEGFDFDLSNIIEGYSLSVSFQSGALQGREFELKYYDKDTTINTSDGLTFEAKAGDYEILFIEEGSYIIPSMTGLVPSDGDSVILFNIKMPSEYTQSAYDELESELDNEIARMTSDLNNYTTKSNPVAFNENNPNLSVGRKVKYVNGNYSFSTRVLKLTTQLDFPIEQEITLGNAKVKGNTQQLKEEVATANKDLNLLAVFNEMTQSIQQSYARTQQMMLEGFAAIKNIWQLKEDTSGKKYIWSEFHVVTQQGMTSYADNITFNIPSIYDGLPIDNQTLYWEETTVEDGTVSKVLKAAGGSGSGTGSGGGSISYALSWSGYSNGSWDGSSAKTIEIPNNTNQLVNGAGYITSNALNGYATETWVTGKGYITSDALNGYATEEWVTEQGYITSHQTIYDLTFKAGAFQAGTFTANSSAKTINIPTTTSHVSEGTNLYFTNERAVSALTGTLNKYLLLSGGTMSGDIVFDRSSYPTKGISFDGEYCKIYSDASDHLTIRSIHGIYMATNNGYTLDYRGKGVTINGGLITYNEAEGYFTLNGNLLVTGGITSYATGDDIPSWMIDAETYDDITSTDDASAYTSRVTTLVKERLDEVADNSETKLTAIKTALSGISSSSTASAIGTALKNIYNNL